VLFDSPPLPGDVDPPKVERIVENLLSNASRHTPNDGRIWARVERTGDGILLTVEDEGDGVPDDLKDAIFEPFRQARGPPPPRRGSASDSRSSRGSRSSTGAARGWRIDREAAPPSRS
jgi:hypothetical protein